MTPRALAACATTVFGVLVPAIAVASPLGTHVALVAWNPNGVSIRAAVGSETTIAFAPGEQITFAEIDDAVRWDAHEADEVTTRPGDLPIQRVAVIPSEESGATLTVHTTLHAYRIRLVGVPHAPANVAFVYARTFINRRPVALAPAPVTFPRAVTQATTAEATAASASPAPRESAALPAHASTTVRASAPAVATPAATPLPPGPPMAAKTTSAPPDLSMIPKLDVADENDMIAKPFDPNAKKGGCPPDIGTKASVPLQVVEYGTQAADALQTAKAVRNGAITHAFLGLHGLIFYAGTFLVEDLLAHHFTKRSCANTKDEVNYGMAAAAGVNAILTPTSIIK